MFSPKRIASPLKLTSPLCQRAAIRRVPLVQQHRTYRQQSLEQDDGHTGLNDLILSILQANPSIRDTRSYLGQFGSQSTPQIEKKSTIQLPELLPLPNTTQDHQLEAIITTDERQAAIAKILDPVQRRTALVKIQGPFTDRQLDSICRGLVYLEKLGLVSIIVVTRDDWYPGQERETEDARDDVFRVTSMLERNGARARPMLYPIVRLGPMPNEDDTPSHSTFRTKQEESAAPGDSQTSNSNSSRESTVEEINAHAVPGDLVGIRSALISGEIPVLTPLALDSFCRTVRVSASDVIGGLVKAMVKAGSSPLGSSVVKRKTSLGQDPTTGSSAESDVDLTPVRVMVINREGGVPSYARTGLPHLLINLSSECEHIHSTYQPQWHHSHPTSLANLRLAKVCLSHMPPTSSAIIVSHRSPRSLIANLVTNKPALSSSLPDHLLVSGPKKLTPHTPTLIRRGLPMRVIQRCTMHEIDKAKLTNLMEKSFKRTLEADAFYARLEQVLDYIIVAGDYAGAAIVTKEPIPSSDSKYSGKFVSYLDKFAVHPSHQGDGTVDFLWVALHDESFGLGLDHALNPNQGGQMGVGKGQDLVWRSRSDNPANKWYFERSSGHLRLPSENGGQSWTMFWCDAEDRLKEREHQLIREEGSDAKRCMGRKGKGIPGLSFVEEMDKGRLDVWAEVVADIPGSWTPIAK